MFRVNPRTLLAAGVFVFLLNTAYLAAFASPSLFYFTNVVAHLVLGIVLAIAYGRRLLAERRGAAPWILAASLVLAAGVVAGLAIAVVGAAGHFRWLRPTHIALSVAGGLPLILYAAALGYRRLAGTRRLAFTAACAVVWIGAVASVVIASRYDGSRKRHYRILNPLEAPLAMDEEGAGPDSPFFPSSADTNVHRTIPATFFMTSQSCGRCHVDIYNQWNSSAHHFSSFNNQWYRKSIEYMQDVVGTQPSKWCAGCHDHAVFFNGRFDRPIKEQIDTPEAQNGLGCTSCHSVVHVKSTMGQADFTIEYPPLHDLAVSENPWLQWAHDKFLRLDPEPRKQTFLKSFHKEQTPEFCSSCHKVHLDIPVNSYRWFRGFNDYDNWQASGVSGEGARSFYYPPKSQKCTDCHMPLVDSTDPAAKNGKVKSHRFPAANTALPFVNHDTVQLKAVQDFLRDGQISVDLFGITRALEPAPEMAGQT